MVAGMRLDFQAINRAALASLPALLRRWLPEACARWCICWQRRTVQ